MAKVVQINVRLVSVWFRTCGVDLSKTDVGQSGIQVEELRSKVVRSLAMS